MKVNIKPNWKKDFAVISLGKLSNPHKWLSQGENIKRDGNHTKNGQKSKESKINILDSGKNKTPPFKKIKMKRICKSKSGKGILGIEGKMAVGFVNCIE